ncbi:hypothetical protein [Leucobacter sp. OH1287]|uniref:hypothetical protein n=1 Tax=Leucobacter sp. OH1287 TaxID=2491049 RepID=UPI000F95D6D4|nr:hypothetical protein [Leucobacter sp. OH1287]RRD61620.1 hypothetical protein EII30_01990 [Leucobacter sp. OH1287]
MSTFPVDGGTSTTDAATTVNPAADNNGIADASACGFTPTAKAPTKISPCKQNVKNVALNAACTERRAPKNATNTQKTPTARYKTLKCSGSNGKYENEARRP